MDKKNGDAVSIPALNIYTYYDLLAVLCHLVHNLPPQFQLELFKISSSDFSRYVREATKWFPSLSLKDSLLGSGYPDLDMTLVTSVLELTKSEEVDVWAILLGAICRIDTMLSDKNSFRTFLEGRNCKVLEEEHGGVSDSYFEFKGLNSNTEEHYGMIVPKLFCEWEKESTRTIDSLALNPLSFSMKNHLWVSQNDKWKITNLFCDFRNVGFNEGILNEGQPFRIVSSPLNRQAPFCIELDESKGLFYIRYLDQFDDILKKRLEAVIDYAISATADIVIFPEMMGTEGCIQFCKEYISEKFCEYKPKLFLLPTWEHKEDEIWNNTLYALDENGDCIFKYNKQHPFIFEKECDLPDGTIKRKFFEPISSDEDIFVIHVPGIGRIGILICSDVFEKDYIKYLVEDLRITLLLYPVFTSGVDLMERALVPTIERSCDVVLCNTCAAWDDALVFPNKRKENNTFNSSFISVYYPTGHMQDRGSPIQKSAFVSCKETECNGCLFITDLQKRYTGETFQVQQVRLEALLI